MYPCSEIIYLYNLHLKEGTGSSPDPNHMDLINQIILTVHVNCTAEITLLFNFLNLSHSPTSLPSSMAIMNQNHRERKKKIGGVEDWRNMQSELGWEGRGGGGE